MAIRLQFLSVVVRREAFTHCPGLPAWYAGLSPGGGFFFDTTWFDSHLWCETSMDGAEDILERWQDQGLRFRAPDGYGEDICLAASGRGPLGPCPWLDYDPSSNCVWLAGTHPGPAIGGRDHQRELEAALAQAEARGEAACELMYEARRPKEPFEDASRALGEAISLARFLNQDDDLERISARLASIQAVYRSQFRGW